MTDRVATLALARDIVATGALTTLETNILPAVRALASAFVEKHEECERLRVEIEDVMRKAFLDFVEYKRRRDEQFANSEKIYAADRAEIVRLDGALTEARETIRRWEAFGEKHDTRLRERCCHCDREEGDSECSVHPNEDEIEDHSGHEGACGLSACTAAHERDKAAKERP